MIGPIEFIGCVILLAVLSFGCSVFVNDYVFTKLSEGIKITVLVAHVFYFSIAAIASVCGGHHMWGVYVAFFVLLVVMHFSKAGRWR